MTMNSTDLHRRNFLLHLQERAGYDQPVLLKEPAHEQPARLHLDQLHNEYAITTQLTDVAGVRPAYALEGTESRPVLLLEYIQGQSLAELIRSTSLDMAEKLQLAVNITTVLGRIHDQQVMHKDISIGNILVADNDQPGSQDGVYIIDFGIASTMRQESLSHLAPDDALVGSLAYISPEQTGRINRHVDYRTDLYSLGVILYELFTGQLPYESDDALEMIHAHIARQPRPPHQIDAAIPGPLSEIVIKLLAKNAEDRYQTAQGLQIDFQRCLEQWQNNKRIEPFALGNDDFTGRLQIPQKLYGRQWEIAQLAAAYDRMVQSNTELMYIAGYSGVGKTALVHEIRRNILMEGGVFIEGKFDRAQRMSPYSAWAQAFTQLVNNWLAESETRLAGWRETILEAVGNQGQILIDVIPSLEHIIGPQPEAPRLGGTESQNRFNYIFNRFINGLARPEHPLVVFLDDLQWIDSASLNLIESLLAIQTASNLLLIGAYRDNEVGLDHPLTASQEKMRDEGIQVTTITLQDLTPDDTNHMLADTLQLTVADCRELSQALVDKTAGNPFYFQQQLYTLESEALLSFDRQRYRWVWAEDVQQRLQASGNVIDLMVSRIQTLPLETQQTLSMAACIGSRFEISTLDTITGRSQMDILSNLNPALQSGLVFRSNGYFTFAHDRVQEAGYSLIPPADLPKTHLEIGHQLLADATDEDLDEEIFAIVGHLNAGLTLIDTDSEKIELARLNLRAGQKAKAAAAFADAKQYVEIGLDLLEPDCWQEQYALTLSLHNENGELAASTGQYDQVSTTAELVQANAKSTLDQTRIYMAQIEAETAQYKFAKALKIGLEVLKDLGINIPTQPAAEDYQRLEERLAASMAKRVGESWREPPEMSDETALAASSLLASEMSTAYIGNPSLYPIIAFEGAILTFEHGLCAWSPFFLACVAMITLSMVDLETSANTAKNQILFAKRMQEIARTMLKNPVTARSTAKSQLMMAFVSVWTEPIENSIKLCRAAYLSGAQTGDALYRSFGTIQFMSQSFVAGMNLVDYQSQLSDYTDSMSRIGQKLAPQWLALGLQTAQNFREVLPDPDRLQGTYLDEDEWLPIAIASNDMSGRHKHSICKLLLGYHFDVDDRLEEYIGEAEDLIGGGKGQITLAQFYLYSALGRLRLAGENGTKDDPGTMNLVNSYLQLLEIWSESAPTTFQHMCDLIMAEKAKVVGNVEGALVHYERSIQGARESDFIHDEALANELYARFWAERGNDRFAGPLMREAHSLYRKWGALAKDEHLEKRYPQWLARRSIVVDDSRTPAILEQMPSDVDLLTVLRVSQEIASEIKLGSLLDKVMTLVLENSGAQRGYLLLRQDGQWMIAAQANVDGVEAGVMEAKRISDSDLLAQGVVHYVARTQQTVVLEDAAHSGEFVNDPRIQQHHVKSLLCTPLISQGKTRGILYLENNLATHVFNPQRVGLLALLSSQMAISIDNARIYGRLERLLAERSAALDSAEDQIRILFGSAQVGIGITTPEGDILSANQALLGMTGYTEAEIQQLNVRELYFEPTQRSILLERLQESDAVQEFGTQILRKDGTFLYASLNVSKLSREGADVLLAVVEDVSRIVEAEEALRSSENLLRVVAENYPAFLSIILKDEQDLTIGLTTGKEFEKLGLEPDSFVGMTIEELFGEQASIVREHYLQAFMGEEVSFELLYNGQNQLYNAYPLLDESGEIGSILVVVQNIDERKLLEAQLTEAAARAERDRLAQDLHDSVTQGLYSASLIAETLPVIWEEEPEEGRRGLKQLERLTQGALAEMRALLLELRPEALVDQELPVLLRQLADATMGRTRTVVTTTVAGDCSVPTEVKIALYRIAQEALNNVVKHARARQAWINLQCREARDRPEISLRVGDDGLGFDPEAKRSQGLGLGTMRERAGNIDATLTISSQPDQGTEVLAEWSAS